MDELTLLIRRPGVPIPPGAIAWEDLPDLSVDGFSEAFDDVPQGAQLRGDELENLSHSGEVGQIESDGRFFAGLHGASDLGFLVSLRQFLRYHLSLRLAIWSRHLADGSAGCAK